MGYSSSHNSAFLVIALVLFSTAIPLAHGQILSPGLLQAFLPPFLVGILRPLLPGIFPPTNTPPITIPPITLPPVLPVSPPISVGVPPALPIATNGTIVSGTICCTPTGTCPGTPVSGALVRVNCTNVMGASVLVGQNTTGVNGTFNISIPNIVGVVPNNLGQFPCVTTIQLPLNETICPALAAANGVLFGVVGTITTLATQLFGIINSVALSGFVRVGG